MDSREFLEMVAGERCPCGHLGENHNPPQESGDRFGPCQDEACGCKGLIQLGTDDDIDGYLDATEGEGYFDALDDR